MSRWNNAPKRLCKRCNRFKPHCAKGYCWSCYSYRRRPYKPTGAGMGGAGVPRTPAEVADRLAEYADLRARHYTIEQAALRVGLSTRTGHRYEARLKSQKGAPA